MKSESLTYSRLLRLYQAPSIGLMPVMGALAVGESSPLTLAGLFSIGVLIHFFFSLANEILDVESDRSLGNLSVHPLITGAAYEKTCYRICIASAFAPAILAVSLNQGAISLMFFILAFILLSTYTLVKTRLRGAEILLAFAFTSLTIFGSTVSNTSLHLPIFFMASAIFFHTLIITTVYRGLWLAQFKNHGNRKTLPMLLGASKRGDRFVSSNLFVIYVAAVQAAFVASVFLLLITGGIPIDELPYFRLQVVTLFFLFLSTSVITYKIIISPFYRTHDIRKGSIFHYIAGGVSITVALIGWGSWVLIIPVVVVLEIVAASTISGAGVVSPPLGTQPPSP